MYDKIIIYNIILESREHELQRKKIPLICHKHIFTKLQGMRKKNFSYHRGFRVIDRIVYIII